jgi:nitrite transporter NirC
MPLPIPEALELQDTAAAAKAAQVRSSVPRYFVSSMLAGAYVGVAVVLLIMTSAAFVASKHPAAKLVQGGVFGVALTLVVFAGAELFTGNNMVMLQGLFSRKVSQADVGMVWGVSLVGNFVGAVLFAALVHASGVMSVAAPGAAAGPTVFHTALEGIVKAKDALSGGQLFARAVLCNFLVCLALWMAVRAASDGAKLIVLWWALLAFVASGFEHSIANMTLFSLGIFDGVATWGQHLRNLLYTIPGNVVGGGLFVGLAYAYAGRPTLPWVAMPTPAPEATVGNGNGAKARKPRQPSSTARAR